MGYREEYLQQRPCLEDTHVMAAAKVHKRAAYSAIDDRRTTRVACVRTVENVLFTILHWVLFGTCLRVIHLQQIRFDRSGLLVVIHARDSILISFDALILSNVTVKIGSINCFRTTGP